MNGLKNIYIAVHIEEEGKFYAHVIKTTDNINLVSILNNKGIKSANVWSKTEAYHVVKCWNEQFKKNGVYMFDSPSF